MRQSSYLCCLLLLTSCHPGLHRASQNDVPHEIVSQRGNDAVRSKLIACENDTIKANLELLGTAVAPLPSGNKIRSSDKPKVHAIVAAYDVCLPPAKAGYASMYGNMNVFSNTDSEAITLYIDINNAQQIRDTLAQYGKGGLTNAAINKKLGLIKQIADETAAVYKTSWEYKFAVENQQAKLVQAQAALDYARAYNPEMVRMQRDIAALKQQNDELSLRVGMAEDDAYAAKDHTLR